MISKLYTANRNIKRPNSFPLKAIISLGLVFFWNMPVETGKLCVVPIIGTPETDLISPE
jgi:hypothetical protein